MIFLCVWHRHHISVRNAAVAQRVGNLTSRALLGDALFGARRRNFDWHFFGRRLPRLDGDQDRNPGPFAEAVGVAKFQGLIEGLRSHHFCCLAVKPDHFSSCPGYVRLFH